MAGIKKNHFNEKIQCCYCVAIHANFPHHLMFSSAAPKSSSAESYTHPPKRDRWFPHPIAERQRLPKCGNYWQVMAYPSLQPRSLNGLGTGPTAPMLNSSHHYSDAIMSAMASQITSVSIVYSTVCSGTDQRKHQSSSSLKYWQYLR